MKKIREALEFYASSHLWRGCIEYKKAILPPRRPLTPEEAQVGEVFECLVLEERRDTGQKAKEALAELDQIQQRLESDLVTPVGLSEELGFYFPEAQAIAIAEHVYQPLQAAINTISKQLKEKIND